MLDIFLAIAVVGLSAVFFYFVAILQRDGYWRRRGIPTPKGDLLLGNLKALASIQYPNVLQIRDWTKQFGKIYGFREGWRQVLVTSDPDMVNELLVKKFEYFHGRKMNPLAGNVDKEKRAHVFSARGARWKRLRTISAPSFNVNNLKKIMPTVDDSVQVMMEHLQKTVEKGQPLNIHPYFHELTMDVICRIAMGQRGSKQFENPAVDVCKRVFADFALDWRTALSHMLPFEWFITPFRAVNFALASFFKKPFKELLDVLYKEVENRKRLRAEAKIPQGEDSIDFIDLFLDAEDPTVHSKDGSYDHKSGQKVSKKMTTDEVVAQCFVFLLAGFDTTANTLANTMWFLAKDPERQKKLQAEIDEVCADENITYEQIQSLKYADAVMKEALRMVPIAAFAASRECMETTTLGDMTIEKGTHVQVDVFTLHYDKRLWGEDADKFIPERFINNETRHPGAFVPFGGGPRTCIGMRLAYLEEKLALARIMKEYDVVECEKTEDKLKLIGASVLNPESVTIKLVKRA